MELIFLFRLHETKTNGIKNNRLRSEESRMISENCSIDEFVEAVKNREAWEVIVLAVEEATRAERLAYHAHGPGDDQPACSEQYSHHLKQLIDYLRYTVKIKHPNDDVYRLYTTYWENPETEPARIVWMD
jgi:hypothetical protein